MSETNEIENIKEGSSADETDDSNGYVHVGPTDEGAEEGAGVFIESANLTSTQDQLIDTNQTTSELGKDEFVDCPDEIETSETQTSLGDINEEQEIQSREFNVHDPLTEVHHLHYMLEKTGAERDSFAHRYQEEREMFMNHLTQLHYQLESLISTPINQVLEGDDEQDVITKCYKYLEFFSNEKFQIDQNMALKDQEIEGLNAKLTETEFNNKNLLEQVNNQKVLIDNLNLELEREKTKLVNTKEKLSMAVTKGKALVQHRDSLKQSISEKINELNEKSNALDSLKKIEIEKSNELERVLKEKSDLLEEVEKSRDLLVNLESMVGEKDEILQKCGVILSEAVTTEELQLLNIVEKIRWLIDERKEMLNISLELSSFDYFPESVKLNGFDFQVKWIIESYNCIKEDIDRLNEGLRVETQEKEYIKGEFEGLKVKFEEILRENDGFKYELEGLRVKYEEIVEKEGEAEKEKGRMVNLQGEFEDLRVKYEEILREKDEFRSELEGLRVKYEEKEAESSREKGIIVNIQAELEDLRSKYEEIVDKEVESSREKDGLRSELEGLRLKYEEIVEKEAESLSEKGKIVNIQAEFEDLRSKYEEIVEKEAESSREKDRFKSELEDLRSKYEELVEKEAESSREKGSMVNIQAEYDDLKAKYEELVEKEAESSSEKGKIVNIQAEFDDLRAKYEELVEKEAESSSEKGKIVNIQAEFEDLRSKYEELVEKEAEFSREKGKIVNIQAEFDDLRAKYEEIVEKEAESSREKDRFKSELEDLRSKYQEIVEKEGESSREKGIIVNIQAELEDLRSKYEEKEAESSNQKGIIVNIQAELSDLQSKYEEIVEKEAETSREKGIIVNKLLEGSGIAITDQEKDYNAIKIIDKCIDKMNNSVNFSHFEKIQSLLYIKNIELTLYDHICEEEIIDKAELTSLSSELTFLKNEKESLQKDLERSEEKVTAVREKLTLAVKKGKGIFQERENLKKSLSEINSENDVLKGQISKLEDQISKLSEDLERIPKLEDQISKFSEDLERIPKLEDQISKFSEEKNELEKFLEQSNSMLQRVFESFEGIDFPENLGSDLPEEKVKWLVGYFRKSKDEFDNLEKTVKVFQDGLLNAESKFSELLEEKNDLESSRDRFAKELEKTIEDSKLQLSKFEEVFATQKSLEDALEMEKSKFSKLLEEKNELESSRDHFAKELNKFEEVIATQKSLEEALEMEKSKIKELESSRDHFANKINEESLKFEEVCATQKSLEDALEIEKRKFSELLEEKKELESSRDHFAKELEKVNEVNTTQKSLEDALEIEKSNFFKILEEKKELESSRDHFAKEADKIKEALSEAQQNIDKVINEKSDLEKKIEKLKEEVNSNVLKLNNANITIKSLEDKISHLLNEKNNSELEISELNQNKATIEKVLEERDLYRKKISHLENIIEENEKVLEERDLYRNKISDLENVIEENKSMIEKVLKEKDLYSNIISDMENKMQLRIEEFQEKEKIFEKEAEISLKKGLEAKDTLMSQEEIKSLFDKIIAIEAPHKDNVSKIFYIVDNYIELKHQISELSMGLESIIKKLGGYDSILVEIQGVMGLLEVIDKLVVAKNMESENFKLKDIKSQKVVDDLSSKVKLLESASPETVQEKGVFDISLSSAQSEISEIPDVGQIGKNKAVPSPSLAHPRTLRKGSSDHLSINIDSESERLINKEANEEEKGHVFKSLNSSKLVPVQAKLFADRIDGMWVSGSRALMRHPRTRLGVMGYWILVHILLLASIL